MNKGKNDVINANYLSNGMDYGVPVVDICCEQNPEQQNQNVVYPYCGKTGKN